MMPREGVYHFLLRKHFLLAYTGILNFPKVHFMPLYFNEKSTLIPVFANQNPKGFFAFTKKEEK